MVNEQQGFTIHSPRFSSNRSGHYKSVKVLERENPLSDICSTSEPFENNSKILDDFIFIKKDNTLYKVFVYQIIYIKADGNYCDIFTTDKRFVIKKSLVKVGELLMNFPIVRVNKSNLVNLNLVTSIGLESNTIHLDIKTFLIGRVYKSRILKRINILC